MLPSCRPGRVDLPSGQVAFNSRLPRVRRLQSKSLKKQTKASLRNTCPKDKLKCRFFFKPCLWEKNAKLNSYSHTIKKTEHASKVHDNVAFHYNFSHNLVIFHIVCLAYSVSFLIVEA